MPRANAGLILGQSLRLWWSIITVLPGNPQERDLTPLFFCQTPFTIVRWRPVFIWEPCSSFVWECFVKNTKNTQNGVTIQLPGEGGGRCSFRFEHIIYFTFYLQNLFYHTLAQTFFYFSLYVDIDNYFTFKENRSWPTSGLIMGENAKNEDYENCHFLLWGFKWLRMH